MRPVTLSRTLAAAVSDGIAEAQTVAGAVDLTLDGSLVASGVAQLGVQRQVIMASGGNIAAVIFTVYGTDQAGNSITDTITGISGSTVATTLNFLTVTRIAASATTGAETVTAGTNGVGASQWIPLDIYLPFGNTTSVNVTGTVNYSVQVTNDDPFGNASTPLNAVAYPGGALTTQTGDVTSTTAAAYRAIRLLTNSGTDTAAITVTQQGLIV
jgi:hypothetical protein